MFQKYFSWQQKTENSGYLFCKYGNSVEIVFLLDPSISMIICSICVRSEGYLQKVKQKWTPIQQHFWAQQKSILVPELLRSNFFMNSQIYVFSCTFCNGCEALLRFSWCARSPEISLFSVKMCDFPARRREYFDFPARRADFIVLIRGGGPRIFPHELHPHPRPDAGFQCW